MDPPQAQPHALICGPLLSYRRTTTTHEWIGSVLIVTYPERAQPYLAVNCIGAVETVVTKGVVSTTINPTQATQSVREDVTPGVILFRDGTKSFWRFLVKLEMQATPTAWRYHLLEGIDFEPRVFQIPSKTESMRILFHSCNGFSLGADEESFNGPALWRDVLRFHEKKPFHVMIGGGDQIYNDDVRTTGPLKEYTQSNPATRLLTKFGSDLRNKCDKHYFDNYVKWYNTEPFATANGCIPQINMWDDHDIIDGYGSYTDFLMKSPVFLGIGSIAFKYYILFQHHLPISEINTFTSPESAAEAAAAQPRGSIFIPFDQAGEPHYIVGPNIGPYIGERSMSLYTTLGAHIALLAIDTRTERTRKQINYKETYDLIFSRLNEEIRNNTNIKHLILLLSVPIAYPRLQWLEAIFSSPLMGPLKFLNRKFGILSSFFNPFDGHVDLLDDLNDHYTSKHHKAERKELMERLQTFSKQSSVRVTILSGDVHLAAVGRFYSKKGPTINLTVPNDWRYMVNVISSAITNKPPPNSVANLLHRRNKVHVLNPETHETLIKMFDKDPAPEADLVVTDTNPAPPVAAAPADANVVANAEVPVDADDSHESFVSAEMDIQADTTVPAVPAIPTAPAAAKGPVIARTIDKNHVTMPSRNYTIIAEANPPNEFAADYVIGHVHDEKYNMRSAISAGEDNAGTKHVASGGLIPSNFGGLDITIRVEIDKSDADGHTCGYGLNIPDLDSRQNA